MQAQSTPPLGFAVWFVNPAMEKPIRRVFESREDAEARVRHYQKKYGAFPGYRQAIIREVRR